MERNWDRNRKLADYIYDDLNPEEMIGVEKEIQSDPEFSEYYHLNRQVRDYLQVKIQLEEMRSDPLLEDAERLADMAFDVEYSGAVEQVAPPSGKGKRIRTLVFATALAATVAILLSIGLRPFQIDQDLLYDRYYKPIAASDYSQRGEANTVYQDLAEGLQLYMNGNYQQSIDLFSTLEPDEAIRTEGQFFSALSYMGLGQYKSAQSAFGTVLDADTRYQPETLWYLSLCYLKTDEPGKADPLLEKLEHYDGMYKQDAQILRNKLRRLK